MKLNKFYGDITIVALIFGFMTSYSVKLTQIVMGQGQSSEVQWEKRQEVQEKICSDAEVFTSVYIISSQLSCTIT